MSYDPKGISILFPDRLHFHERNFSSLFEFIQTHKIKHHFVEERRDWMALFGDYTSKVSELRSVMQMLQHFDPDELFLLEHCGISVFKVARAEMLSYLLPQRGWNKGHVPSDDRQILNRSYQSDRDVLLLNLAATINWIDFWQSTLNSLPVFSHCMIFSGSTIYTRSLIESLRTRPTKSMLMEHFFTGSDYYCEEKYEHIANNSDLRHTAVYNSIQTACEGNELDRERVKSLNKLMESKNKNVTQPSRGIYNLPFTNKEPVFLVLGQVNNDFSMLETKLENINTISIYEDIITGLLSRTKANIVFKAHPWERKKANINSPLTFDRLNQFHGSLPISEQSRLLVTEDYNLKDLFSASELVVVLNSQSALEAAFEGLKCVRLGKAFYGYKGFTHDYESLDPFMDDLCTGKLSGRLTLAEYQAFELFLVKALQGHLVSVHRSGIVALRQIVAPSQVIKLSSGKPLPPASKSPQVPAPPTAEASKSPQVPAPPTAGNPPPAKNRPSAQAVSPEAPSAPMKSADTVQSNAEKNADSITRKLRKLQRAPHAYFNDSHNPVVRSLRVFFK